MTYLLYVLSTAPTNLAPLLPPPSKTDCPTCEQHAAGRGNIINGRMLTLGHGLQCLPSATHVTSTSPGLRLCTSHETARMLELGP